MQKARTDHDTRKSIYDQELKRYREIKQEIANCEITAPQDGLVVYYVPERGRGGAGSQMRIIAQGETVTEGQKLMRIPDLKHMVVNTLVHEALVSRVRPGQEAHVRVEAYPDMVLRGRVKTVARVAAQPDNWSSTDVKVYPTVVEITDEVSDLRPGMSAEVTIVTQSPRKDVRIVPVQAVVGGVEMGKQRKVFVLNESGLEERLVTVGLSNHTHAEIVEGLEEGEDVITNPRVLVGDREKTRTSGPDESRPLSGSEDRGGPGGPPPDGPRGPGMGPGDDSPGGPGGGEMRKRGGGRRGGMGKKEDLQPPPAEELPDREGR
jgi:hypothetical protein